LLIIKTYGGNMKKQSIKKIALSRLLKVFLLSILVVLSITVLSYRSFFQLVAENKAISIAEVIKAGLTSHMKAGIMDKRAYYLNEIASVYDIESISIIRADIVSRQFGEAGAFDKKLDDDLAKDLKEERALFYMERQRQQNRGDHSLYRQLSRNS